MNESPYRITGGPVAWALSSYYVSRYAFDGGVCRDIREGCRTPPG